MTCGSNRKVWWQCERGHEWQCAPNHLHKLNDSNRCPYCNDRAVCEDNSLLTRYPELAQEWDNELNFPLTPDHVLYCSSKKYWWRRGEFVWQASIKDRQRKRDVIPRGQYLACYPHLRLSVTHPELGAQWDNLKNAPLTPDQVTARSGKKVWWCCKHGHTWQSAINKRIRGDGCPYCSGHRPSKEYCLQTCCPAIAAQWHPERNGDLTPLDVTPGSGKVVWWRCEKGHEWKTSVSNRSRRGHNCPIARTAPNDWVESPRNVLTCLRNGILRRTQKCRKITPPDPTKKCGGNAVPAATSGRHPLIAGFAEAVARFVQKNSAAFLSSTIDSSPQASYRLWKVFPFRTKLIARSSCCSSHPNRNPERSRWRLCRLTDAACPLRVLRWAAVRV